MVVGFVVKKTTVGFFVNQKNQKNQKNQNQKPELLVVYLVKKKQKNIKNIAAFSWSVCSLEHIFRIYFGSYTARIFSRAYIKISHSYA